MNQGQRTVPGLLAVIAVLLGWLILSEPITGYTLAGMALIVGGVYGVFREKGKRAVPSE